MSNSIQPKVEPYNISTFIEAHAPFLPRSLVEQINDYKTKFDIFSEQMGRFDESQANAEIDRRRKLAGENPTPENIALLGSQSPDEMRKTYAEKRGVFDQLRSACVRQYATPVSRQLLPIIEKLVAEFRTKVNADFHAFHQRWRLPYNPASNPVLQAVDSWMHHHREELRREEWAAENRYPHYWENLLPTPDFFVGICARNLAPMPESAPDTRVKTAAEAAAARAA